MCGGRKNSQKTHRKEILKSFTDRIYSRKSMLINTTDLLTRNVKIREQTLQTSPKLGFLKMWADDMHAHGQSDGELISLILRYDQ